VYVQRLGGEGDLSEVAYQVTAEDLPTASMLSVRVIRYYILEVLVYRGSAACSLRSRRR
jgi:hypothetical protein